MNHRKRHGALRRLVTETLGRERVPGVVARLRAEAAARRRQPSRAFCVECEEPIPEKRRALGGVQYCVDCQELIDRNNQLYGR